jgi:hypothetical protein
MKNIVLTSWNFIFDYDKSPLRHIPEGNIRHMVYQMLAWMWAISFSIAIGSYSIIGVSLIAHTVLVGAAAITVAVYTTASVRPESFKIVLGRRNDGEHV